MKKKIATLNILSHTASDITQGGLPAMLPFLIERHHLSYTEAAGLIFALAAAASLIQPIFGYYSDKYSLPYSIPLGVALSGLGLAGVALSHSYPQMLLCALTSGLGLAAFHPEGARMIHLVSGDKKGIYMSWFGVGGITGFAIGPLFVTAVMKLAPDAALWLAFPALLMAGLQVIIRPWALLPPRPISADHTKPSLGTNDWKGFSKLTGVVMLRSALLHGLNMLIPLYFVAVLMQEKGIASLALTLFALSGLVGNLVGGWAADRRGKAWVMIGGAVFLLPWIPLLSWSENVGWSILLIVPVGFFISASYSPSIVLGQDLLPNHIGFSAGITLGVAVGFGGLVTPLLGMLADLYSLNAPILALSLLPVPAVLLTLSLFNKAKNFKK